MKWMSNPSYPVKAAQTTNRLQKPCTLIAQNICTTKLYISRKLKIIYFIASLSA